MTTKELQSKIWKLQQTKVSKEYDYWSNISIALEVVEN